MLADHWRKDRFAVALVLIAVAGLLWRVAYVVWSRNGTLSGDGYNYHYGALALVDRGGFYDPITGAPSASHPPAWQILLAVPSALGLRSWLSHQLFACLIGTATILMTGLAGRAAFGRRVGVVAAALAAVYPLVWLYERAILSEPLAILGTATTIWLAYRFRSKPGLGLAVALGVAVGFMAMTRAELILVAVLLVVPLLLSARQVRLNLRLRWLTAAAVACVLVMAPWAIYNSTRFERPVPFSNAAGVAMLQGNCNSTYHGELLGYYKFGCALFVKNFDPDPSVSDGQYREQALRFMRKHSGRVPIVAAARVGRTFGVFRPLQQMHLEAGETATELWVLRLGFVLYWILLPLAIVGVVLARRRRIPVYPLLAFPCVVLIAVLPAIGSVRYRAIAEISLIILAAVGIEASISAVRMRRSHRNAATVLDP